MERIKFKNKIKRMRLAWKIISFFIKPISKIVCLILRVDEPMKDI
jgi:hypothetical protein